MIVSYITTKGSHNVKTLIYKDTKLYNDQRNAQVLNLFIHLLLPYMFWAFF
jgi:hypothetical protein